MNRPLEPYRSLVEQLAGENPNLTREEFEQRFFQISEDQYQAVRNILDHLWELYQDLKKLL